MRGGGVVIPGGGADEGMRLWWLEIREGSMEIEQGVRGEKEIILEDDEVGESGDVEGTREGEVVMTGYVMASRWGGGEVW